MRWAVHKVLPRLFEAQRLTIILHPPLLALLPIFSPSQALIEAPAAPETVSRRVVHFKHVSLTDLLLKGYIQEGDKLVHHVLPRNARQKTVAAFFKTFKVLESFAKSSAGKRVASKAAKAASNDFERFQAKVKKQVRAKAIKAKLGGASSGAAKKGAKAKA